ncbi:hypothetical protein CA13_38580 [Planctomycetes bacterium CA13]|uniref:Planctomycete cytochrome C n=1 Tax=Novipirellula herctigrandis TaxID=2527986 RepID=A0A5C5Z5B1_9BACT|nr:hypothetical protein CA13_38580 [Planctomycetes bacterium CA13]
MDRGFSNRRAPIAWWLCLIGVAGVAMSDEPPMLRIIHAQTNFDPEPVPTIQSKLEPESAIASPSSEPTAEPKGAEEISPLTLSPSVASPPQELTIQNDGPRACVLLHNGNVVYGTAHQRGEFVVIRRESGVEIQLSRNDVACWANSIHDLYKFRVDNRRDSSVATRLNEIRWCLRYDLFGLAAAELVEVYSVDPSNGEARKLENRLRRAAEVAMRQPSNPSTSNQDFKAASTDVAPPSPMVQAIVDSSEHIRDFSRYVQPLLINRCGQCHSHTSEQAWQLNTPSIGQRATSRMTRQNLTATLGFVDLDSPLDSELLQKSTTAHGDEPAGNDARRSAAAATLLHWIASIEATVPRLQLDQPKSDSLGQYASPISSEEIGPSELPKSELGEATVNPRTDDVTSDPKPSRLPKISNPFDPELFNRKYLVEKDH